MTDMAFTAGEFRVGEVVGMALSILLRKIVPIALITALGMLPAILLSVYLLPSLFPDLRAQDPNLHQLAVAGIAFGIITVFGCLVAGALTYGVYLGLVGRGAGIDAVMRHSLANLLSLIGVGLLLSLLFALGFVLLVVPGFIVFVMLFVAFPAAVIERAGVTGSLGRSAELTKGFRWKLFGLFLAVLGIQTVLDFVSGFFFGFFGAMFDVANPEAYSITFASILNLALWSVFATVCYYQLRLCKEGLSGDQLAAALD